MGGLSWWENQKQVRLSLPAFEIKSQRLPGTNFQQIHQSSLFFHFGNLQPNNLRKTGKQSKIDTLEMLVSFFYYNLYKKFGRIGNLMHLVYFQHLYNIFMALISEDIKK
jgi:hypothetical protein